MFHLCENLFDEYTEIQRPLTSKNFEYHIISIFHSSQREILTVL